MTTIKTPELTETQRGAIGELMKLSLLFYTTKGAHKIFGIICAERAVGILEGKVTPHVASDDLIDEFRKFWAPPKRRRRLAMKDSDD